jgi:hypothetical protein
MAIEVDISEIPLLKRIFDDGVSERARVLAAKSCARLTERLGFVVNEKDRELMETFTAVQSSAFLDTIATTKEFSSAMNAAISAGQAR